MNEEYKIEKGVPIPKPIHTGLTKVLRTMEVGDSMFCNKTVNQVSSVARALGRATGRRFTCWKEDNGVRVWRSK